MIDGKNIIECKENGTEEYKKGTAKLKRGKHTIIVKTVYTPGDTIDSWKFDAFIEMQKTPEPDTRLSLVPVRNITIGDILDPPHINSVNLSPDGSLAALMIRTIISPDGEIENKLEIRNSTDGSLVRTIICREGIKGFKWTPDG